MDLDLVAQIISTVGFPIVAVIACGFFIYKIYLLYRTDCNNRIKEIEGSAEHREKLLYEQINSFTEVLDNFSETLIRVDAKLESIERIMSYKQ